MVSVPYVYGAPSRASVAGHTGPPRTRRPLSPPGRRRRPTRGSTGAAGRPGPRSGDQAGVVADLAHQLLEHVLEGDDADHGAVRVGGGAEVEIGRAHV